MAFVVVVVVATWWFSFDLPERVKRQFAGAYEPNHNEARLGDPLRP